MPPPPQAGVLASGMLRLNNINFGGTGLCHLLKCKEENVRIFLLAVLLYGYLAIGAVIFQTLESTGEIEIRSQWAHVYQQFLSNFTIKVLTTTPPGPNYEDSNNNNNNLDNHHHDNGADYDDDNADDAKITMSQKQLDQLLQAYGEAIKAGYNGINNSRDRWDHMSSFHFAWTIVSTIGYGALTPTTEKGRLFLIIYGLFGCPGGLLFFNLCLERFITFITVCMRIYRNLRQKRRLSAYTSEGGGRRENGKGMWSGRSAVGSDNESDIQESDWKPSVYSVLISLLILSVIFTLSSATLFHVMEDWTLIESLYFCFVSFSTIGFGDFVILQKDTYVNEIVSPIYRFFAFLIMVFGCSCIYSLLNVMSIVIKQLLNLMIKWLDCPRCVQWCSLSSNQLHRRFSSRRQRSSKRMSRISRSENRLHIAVVEPRDMRSSSVGEETGNGGGRDLDRWYSGDNMVSIRGELSNRVTLAVMQKRLHEASQAHCSYNDNETSETFSATSVGPLAIAAEKLADNNNKRI